VRRWGDLTEAAVETPHVKAWAIVDPGNFTVVTPDYAPYQVTCWGELFLGGDALPRRIYQIAARTDDEAGFEGLRRYEAEMRRPN
jgi:hypothetical protein